MARKILRVCIDEILLDMLDNNKAKLWGVSRSELINRALAYFLDCQDDFMYKRGKFKKKFSK